MLMNLFGGLVLAATALAQNDEVLLPLPDGALPLGTERRILVDAAREEVATEDSADKRRLAVQFYYPRATKLAGKKYRNADYLPDFDILKPALGPLYQANAAALSALRVPALEAAPVLPGRRLPLVVFSPGIGTSRLFYTAQVLAIAARGFLVVAIDHSYDVDGVVCEGELVRRKDAQASETEGLTKAGEGLHAGPRLRVWAEDVRFVLDAVLALDKKDPLLRGRIDKERLGYVGHCFGARAVVLAAAGDARIKAVIAENAWPLAVESKTGTMTADLLFAQGARTSDVVWLESQKAAKAAIDQLVAQRFEEQKAFLAELEARVLHVEFADQEHMDFTDLPMLGAWIAARSDATDGAAATPQRSARRDLVDSIFVDFLATRLLGAKPKHLAGGEADRAGYRVVPIGTR
mgnify:CR=1 FL=1